MRISTWRLALTGGAIIVLAVAGIGLAAAASSRGPAANLAAAASPTANPDASTGADRAATHERLARLRDGGWPGRLLRAGRHLVHAEITLTDRDGKLVNLQADHGTVQSVGAGSLTIGEAGGGNETISFDAATLVYVGREDGDLGDVAAGAEVFVLSRLDGGAALAKRILVVTADGS